MPAVFIPGGQGRKIEAKYAFVPRTGRTRARALVLHQHAALGGGMDHRALYQAYYALVGRGFEVARFNFRGVGASNGDFSVDEGEGEVNDANAVLDWMQERTGGGDVPVLVVGFGYGAWIGAHLMARRPEVTDVVLVTPEPNLYDFSFMSEFCPARSLIVSAGRDEVVPARATDDLLFALSQLQLGKSEHVGVADADHSLSTGLEGVLGAVLEYVDRRF
jgi:alpha/beta superfamily hydrolase